MRSLDAKTCYGSYRVTAMRARRRNFALSILFTVFGGPGILLVYLPFWMTRFRFPAGQPLWQTMIAAALIVIGLAPALESVRRFIYAGHGTLVPVAPPERLVVTGFYRYVRNPMYVGALAVLGGEAILFRSGGVAIAALLALVGFDLFVRLYEERSLARRYPEEYARYRRHVRRWRPRLTPWQEGED